MVDMMPLSIPKKSKNMLRTTQKDRSIGIIFNTPIVTLYSLFLANLSSTSISSSTCKITGSRSRRLGPALQNPVQKYFYFVFLCHKSAI